MSFTYCAEVCDPHSRQSIQEAEDELDTSPDSNERYFRLMAYLLEKEREEEKNLLNLKK